MARPLRLADWATARPYRDYAAYFISKGAIPTMTRMLAVELSARNPAVRVNAILPGYFETPMNTHFFATPAGQKIIRKNIPAGRLGQQDEMRGIAIYLASEASSFMTGSAIVIDGGQTCW